MKNFNLTEWALNHKHFIYFFMLLFFVTGLYSYNNLGRMEDPDFTIKQMIVNVSWPGATAREVEEQVTDKIEKKLQDLPGLDYVKSFSKPGIAVIYVHLKDTVPQKDVRLRWLEAQKMVNDIKNTLPSGASEPAFNDRFDDVYGVMYALTGDGYTYEEMREKAERIRRILLGVPSVNKVQLVGVQTEKIYIEIENSKLAQLGISPELLTSTLAAQNAKTAAGMLETASDNIYLRITGMFEQLEDIRNVPIQTNGRTFRLGDIAKVTRAYAEPSDPKFYYNGEPAIGISLAMKPGDNILTLGENLAKTIEQVKKELPAGLEIHQTVNQPEVVKTSINLFIKSLMEAIVIVLLVSFASLGARAGLIVAMCIPLVILITFCFMDLFGIQLQRISLGALIIALGLLVDDAIITIETMIVKLEQGWTRFNAACFSYTSTGYPRLTGALVTVASFIPVSLAAGSGSEYCITIFYVIAIALISSWVVAGTVTPLMSYLFIKIKPKAADEDEHDVYDTKFYNLFKHTLTWCMSHRKIVLAITAVSFFGAMGLMGLVKQEFFASSTRPELIVQLQLPEGGSINTTDEIANQVAAKLNDNPLISYYTYHVGEGAPRFVLSFEPTFSKTNFAEFIIVANDYKARDQLNISLSKLVNDEFPSVHVHTKIITNGPSAEYPVMLRVNGYDQDKVLEIAEKVRIAMEANPEAKNVNLNWNEKSKIIHLAVDQDKARNLGITSQTLSNALQAQLSGTPFAEFREYDKTVNMVFRFDSQDRYDPSRIKNLNIQASNGQYIPLDQIAKISFDTEHGLIYRRDLKPMVWVQAEITPGATGDDIAQQVYESLADVRANLPLGYSIDYDATKSDSVKANKYIAATIPAMLISIMILLITQLQSIPKLILTLLTAPLGLIGVSIGLLVTNSPMGFVVTLGILALAGIIMRNTVVLMDQISQQLEAGESLWDAIVNATIIRFRPICLTAAAAILGMVPLFTDVFWGPMAIAIAAGLAGATILTLLVLPVMYATLYRAQPATNTQDSEATTTKNGLSV
ncbi:Cobalt-zinc-cadmium resistance protein CzcA [Sporomusa silvacetica DSM 10669]|uniref:Cobalt-zinc-cadmium resistance protein CzcA n=1 Tax=Sporomusa silvacetica DSM 10669 TaxID=1123289 RepID=A0ABZ3IFU5_9FIRM|nr:efflux RND transporter permease subunit [Sporomusa silvacetica]OZC17072.1 efflux pump membrane transporter BepE [Sporomusa silvacetica DSM 10669]